MLINDHRIFIQLLFGLSHSYGAGFIFTTSLPPTVMRGAKASIEVLRSDEGRTLRQRHGENVRYLRSKLFEAGVAAVHTPSHIIPIHVSCVSSEVILY